MAMTFEHVEVFNVVVDIVRQGVGAIIMDSTRPCSPLVVYVKTIHRSIISHGVEAGALKHEGRASRPINESVQRNPSRGSCKAKPFTRRPGEKGWPTKIVAVNANNEDLCNSWVLD